MIDIKVYLLVIYIFLYLINARLTESIKQVIMLIALIHCSC